MEKSKPSQRFALISIVPYSINLTCVIYGVHVNDMHGRNIAGPPPRPLQEYDVKIKDDEIYISKKI
ncbi:MAG: hypothetical protein ACE5D7_02670 [Fidelibacterota bacterium]